MQLATVREGRPEFEGFQSSVNLRTINPALVADTVFYCDLCGETKPSQIYRMENCMGLCAECHVHLMGFPEFSRRRVERTLMGNVI